jgi:hypothetical protein
MSSAYMAFIYIVPLVLGDWYLRRDERMLTVLKSKIARIILYWLILLCLLSLLGEKQSFLYFQF